MLNKIMQELMNEQGAHYMPIEKLLGEDKRPQMRQNNNKPNFFGGQRQQTANFEVSDTENDKRPQVPDTRENPTYRQANPIYNQAHPNYNQPHSIHNQAPPPINHPVKPSPDLTSAPRAAQNYPHKHSRQPLHYPYSQNQTIAQPLAYHSPQENSSFNYYMDNVAKMAHQNTINPSGYGENFQHTPSRDVSVNRDNELRINRQDNYDPITNQDDLILDIKLHRGAQNRHFSQTNDHTYQDMSMTRPKDLPQLNNIRHDAVARHSETRKHIHQNQPIYNPQAPYTGLTSTKLPKLSKIHPKPSKISKTLKKPSKHLPHYMRLRRQDVDNKLQTKRKIRHIQNTKPQIKSTPRKQKWIPVKIEPKGAALNAKFYKGKPKPSIEVSRSDQASSRKRLRKIRQVHGEDFDRSESHCRRCEA